MTSNITVYNGPSDLISPNDLIGPNDLVGPNDLIGPNDLVGPNDLIGPNDLVGQNDLVGPRDLIGPTNLVGPIGSSCSSSQKICLNDSMLRLFARNLISKESYWSERIDGLLVLRDDLVFIQ